MGLLRATGSPFRDYFNSHFEMVKDEVRRTQGAALPDLVGAMGGQAEETRAVVANVAAAVSESHLFLARQLAEVRAYGQLSTDMVDRVLAELRGTSAAIDELRQHVADQLAAVTESVHRLGAQVAELDAHVVMYGATIARTEDRTAFVEQLLDVASSSR